MEKKFDVNLLKPKKGKIGAMIFRNNYLGIKNTLYFNIEINLEKFRIRDKFEDYEIDEEFETKICLDFISFDIYSIDELENKTFYFPVNPENGYIDGSVYIFNCHNSFDVTKIKFGKILENEIQINISYTLDFDNTEYLKTNKNELQTTLNFGEFLIYPTVVKEEKFLEQNKKINTFFSKFLDILNFFKLRIGKGNINSNIIKKEKNDLQKVYTFISKFFNINTLKNLRINKETNKIIFDIKL